MDNLKIFDEFSSVLEGIYETVRTMIQLAHAEGGVEALVETEVGLNVWQGHCTDLYEFLRDSNLLVGAAVIHIISRHGRLSFTKILPFIEEPEGDMTFARYREYLRQVLLLPDRVEKRVEEIRTGRAAAKAKEIEADKAEVEGDAGE